MGGPAWRVIPFQRYDPYVKTGLNDAALRSAANGDHIAWLSGWDRPCINVGRSQRVQDEIDMDAVQDEDLPIVRRQGGGGTMYLTPDGEVTWGLAAPAAHFPDSLEDIYSHVCGRIVEALDHLGIDARHEPINDVVTPHGKISGATARRSDGAVYVGGTLLYDVDAGEMFRYLTPAADKAEDKAIDRFEERVSSITQEVDASHQDVRDALRTALLTDKKTNRSRWTDEERLYAEQQADTYRKDDWIFMHED